MRKGSRAGRPPPADHGVNPRIFWPFFAAGTLVMAGGVIGLFADGMRTHPEQWIRWFAGALVAHDLVVAPTVFAIATLVVARVAAPVRAPLQAGMIASAVVLLASYPQLRGYGRTPLNTTILPNDYASGVLVVLALIWAAAIAWALALTRGRLPRPLLVPRAGRRWAAGSRQARGRFS